MLQSIINIKLVLREKSGFTKIARIVKKISDRILWRRMDKIESFKVDHLNLFPGVYVSRTDVFGETTITTFDLRMVAPNREPVIDMPALHTIEHLGATYFRNSDIRDNVVYFGPMGCRTGCYLLLYGEWTSEEVFGNVLGFCDFVIAFQGEIPGAKPKECGNYSEQNLFIAKYYVQKYKDELLKNRRLKY